MIREIKNSNFYQSSFGRLKKIRIRQINSFIQKRPLTSFFAVLFILFGLIAASNLLFSTKKNDLSQQEIIKDVAIYQIGSVPKISLQAKVDKSGVIKIVALSPGVVSAINVIEGQQVKKGTNLINLSSNYSGGNAAGLQQSIASKQYQIVKDTYQNQKDIIQKNKELASKSAENSEGLREISNNSLVVSRQNFDLNQEIIHSIDQNIAALQANNIGGVNDQTILQSRTLKSQFEAANQGLRSQIVTTEYTTNPNNPATKLTETQKEVTLKQLDIQEKTLNLSKDIAGLQVSLAAVNAALMYPVAPFGGSVDKIFVHVGEAVNPGTTLLTISGDKQSSSVIALVPENIAKNVSKIEPSSLNLNGVEHHLMPTHISQDATDGALYSVIFNLPEGESSNLTVGNYVLLELPVGLPGGGQTMPYVPLDSVFQGTDSSYVFVANGDKVESKTIELGSVFGRFVEVKKGLTNGDKVILNRNVIAGDKVKVL